MDETSDFLTDPQLSEAPLLARLRLSFFSALHCSLETSTKSASPPRFPFLEPALIIVFDVVCVMSLQLKSDMDKSEFPRVFSTLVKNVRFDEMANRLGLIVPFICVHIVVIGLTLGGVFLKMIGRPPNITVLKLATALPMRYIQHIGFVPVLIALQAYIQYWILGECHVYTTSNDLPGAAFLGPISFIFTILMVAQVSIAVFFDYTIQYSPSKLMFQARSRSVEYFVHKLSRFVVVLAYVWLSHEQFLWVEILFLLTGIINFYLFYTKLPFHSHLWNSLMAWTNLITAWTALAVILGSLLDSDMMVALLIVVISPALFLIVYYQIKTSVLKLMNRKRRVKKLNITTFDYLFRREVDRFLLGGMQDISHIEELLRDRRVDPKQRSLVSLLEASFYVSYVDDYERARKCLAKLNWLHPSWERQYQKYRIQAEISTSDREKEVKYLRLLVAMQNIKDMDSGVCFHIYNFLQELMNSRFQPDKCERLATNIANTTRMILTECQNALTLYPKSSQLLYLYGSFLEEIVNDSSGSVFVEKAKNLQESASQKTTSADLIHTLESFGVICVSANPTTIGEVHFVNEKAMTLLGITKADMKGLNIDSLLPPDLCAMHSELVEEVLVTGLSMGNIVRFYCFILDSNQFNLIVKVTAKTVFWKELPYFFVTIQTNTDKEAVLLFNSHYIIQSHSEKLKTFLGEQLLDNYKGCYLFDIVKELPRDILTYESGTEIPISGTYHIVFFFEHVKLGSKLLYSLSVLTAEVEKIIIKRVSQHRSTLRTAKNRDSKFVRFNTVSEFVSSLNIQEIEEEEKEEEEDRPNPSNSSTQNKFTTMGTMQRMLRRNSISAVSSSVSTSLSHERVSDVLSTQATATCRRLRLFLLLSIICLIAMMVSAIIFMIDMIHRMQEVNVIGDISQRRHLQVDIADATRRFQLVKHNVDSVDYVSLQNRLLEDVKNYTSSINHIKEKISVWKHGENTDMYFLPSTPSFQTRESKVFVEYLDLFEAMYLLTFHTSLVANSKPTDPNMTQSYYYILRNAPAETFKSVNRSIFLFIQDETDIREGNFRVLEGLLAGVALVLSFSFLGLLLPQVVLLERQHSAIWAKIFSTPFDKLIEAKQRVFDRMQSIHNMDVAEMDASVKGKPGIDRNPMRLWPAFAAKISVIGIVTIAFLCIIVFAIYLDLKDLLMTMPNYLNWGGLLNCGIYNMNYWLKEIQIQALPDLAYSAIFKDNYFWPNPGLQFMEAATDSNFASMLLGKKNEKYGLYQSHNPDSYKNYRFSDGCFTGVIDNCELKVEQYGLSYAFFDFVQTAFDVKEQMLKKSVKWKELQELEVVKEDLFKSAMYAVDLYQSESASAILEYEQNLIACATGFCVLVVAIYLFWYLREIAKINGRLTDRTKILKMIAGL